MLDELLARMWLDPQPASSSAPSAQASAAARTATHGGRPRTFGTVGGKIASVASRTSDPPKEAVRLSTRDAARRVPSDFRWLGSPGSAVHSSWPCSSLRRPRPHAGAAPRRRAPRTDRRPRTPTHPARRRTARRAAAAGDARVPLPVPAAGADQGPGVCRRRRRAIRAARRARLLRGLERRDRGRRSERRRAHRESAARPARRPGRADRRRGLRVRRRLVHGARPHHQFRSRGRRRAAPSARCREPSQMSRWPRPAAPRTSSAATTARTG